MESVKQHYIPQFYLNNFSFNRKLYVFDKKNNKYLAEGRRIPISKIGFSKNLYDINPKLIQLYVNDKVRSEKYIDIIIERFNESISATLIKTFKAVEDYIDKYRDIELSSLIFIDDLIDFVIIQLFRTPFFRNTFVSIADKMIEMYSENDIKRLDINIEKLTTLVHGLFIISAIDSTQVWEKLDKPRILKGEFHYIDHFVQNIIDQLKKMSTTLFWIMGIDKYFHTSDNPILIAVRENQEIENITFALTKKCCFTFSQHFEFNYELIKINEQNSNLVNLFNQKIYNSAQRFIYSYKIN